MNTRLFIKTSINKYHSVYLFNYFDAKGLELGTHSPFINNWITSPINMFSGRDFVDMLKHGLLYTHYRCKRIGDSYVSKFKYKLFKAGVIINMTA